MVHRPRKLGLGSAYREGFRVTRGKLPLTVDADLSYDPTHMPAFIEKARSAEVWWVPAMWRERASSAGAPIENS